MIKSILHIKDIGVFKTYNPRLTGLERDFSQFNFIFAENTFGKSTLTDIFKDASNNSTELIESRLTIPGGKKQEVIIRLSDGQGTVAMKNNQWENQSLKNKIMVFDTEFIENNVFDKQEIIDNRETKVNFSDFILGNEGVDLARDLEELNKERRLINRALTNQIPKSQREKSEKELIEYINMDVKECNHSLMQDKEKLNKKIRSLQKTIDHIEKINNINEVSYLELPKLEKMIQKVNVIKEILREEYSMSNDIIKALEDHKVEKIKQDKEADAWIEKGITLLKKDDECPFCGQYIDETNFIKKYQQEFIRGYEEYKKSVTHKIKGINIDWNILILSKKVQSILDLIEYIKENINTDIVYIEDKMAKINIEIMNFENDAYNHITQTKALIDNALRKKKANSSIPIPIDTFLLDDIEDKYQYLLDKTNQILKKLNLQIRQLKNTTKEEYNKELEGLESEKEKIKYKIQRIDESESCENWLKISEKQKELKDETNRISNLLDENQDKYLDKYFEEIDFLFKNFGGEKFTIDRGATSNRGDQKTFGIEIKFAEENVSNLGSISKVFSESDRRALGLAIFMAKIYCMAEDEQKEIILILDDPVTSFDDNRMKSVIMRIADVANRVKQVFIMTHNRMFAREIHRSESDVQKFTYYQIDKIDKNSNGLFDINPTEQFANDLFRAYDRIYKYINHESSNLHYNDLRIFLEEYLKFVFIKQFREHDHSKLNFAESINYLKKIDSISTEVFEELHRYRSMLNPESHEFTESTPQELRIMASNLIDFLFSSVQLRKYRE